MDSAASGSSPDQTLEERLDALECLLDALERRNGNAQTRNDVIGRPFVDELAGALAEALAPLLVRLGELERRIDELAVPEWQTLEQTAERLATTPGALRWRARHGRLPGAVKDEGRWLVDRRVLDDALRATTLRLSDKVGSRRGNGRARGTGGMSSHA
jgi:hypothetical protein